nr:hypothetical protein Iba_chr01aCG8530 [Ipomoea batatas]
MRILHNGVFKRQVAKLQLCDAPSTHFNRNVTQLANNVAPLGLKSAQVSMKSMLNEGPFAWDTVLRPQVGTEPDSGFVIAHIINYGFVSGSIWVGSQNMVNWIGNNSLSLEEYEPSK